MPPITAETVRKNILIGGVILTAPTPYSAGYVLTENEAAAMNQTYLENVGNNFRARVTAAKRKAIVGKDAPTPEELKAVTDEQIKAFDKRLEAKEITLSLETLQPDFDKLVADYKMGVRRSSSVEVIDPITKAARSIAKDKLKAALVARGTKLNTVKVEWYTREIEKLLDRENPRMKGDVNVTENIWKTAERQVNLLKQAASEALDDLDVSDITKAPKAEAAAGTETQGSSASPDSAAGPLGGTGEGEEARKSPRNNKGK